MAANTAPSAVGERVTSKTANARATGTRKSPSIDAVWPANSSLKFRSRRSEMSIETDTASDAHAGMLDLSKALCVHEQCLDHIESEIPGFIALEVKP